MGDLDQLLEAGGQSGVYRITGMSATEALAAARRRHWQGAHINAATVRGKADFLTAAARGLHLPSYFGKNWDAFEECIRDLPPAEGYLVWIEDPALFARSRPQEWKTALSILRDAATFWQAQGRPFYVLLQNTRGSAPDLPLLR